MIIHKSERMPESDKMGEVAWERFFFLSKDFMAVFDRSGIIKSINPSFADLLGIRNIDLFELSIFSFISQQDHEKFSAYMDKAVTEAHLTETCITECYSITNQARLVEWHSLSYSHEGYFYVIGKDITAIHHIETQARESRKILEQIIDLVPYPIFLKDCFGNYLIVNNAQATLFNLSKSEMIGKNDLELVTDPEEYKLIADTDLRIVLKKEQIDLPEQIITDLAGKKRILHTTKIPFIRDHQDGTGILGISIDITEIKRTETELRKINFELDSFVYKSSHDLRAPLRSILGLLDLIKKDPVSESRDITVELAKKSIKTLDSFISDLTNLSRNSRLEIKPEEIEFHKIIYDCIDNLRYMENASKVSIIVDIQETNRYYSDPVRTRIILLNLISNAIKYQDASKKEHRIGIRIFSKSDNLHIIIEDNGIGIEEKYLGRIFEMFFRASENSFGSGLGLYIVKQTIEKLNGDIKVTSSLGKGTTFDALIPNMGTKN